MNFVLTPEQEDIRKMVREYAEKALAPTAAERDEKELFVREIFDEMGQLGIVGLPYPEQYGGAGSDFLSYAIAVEEISRACASTGIGLSVHVSLCAWPIFKYGNEEQKQKYLRPLAEGTKLGGFGLTEPNAGTDASAGSTVAVKDGDSYIINGTKVFNTNGGEAEIEVVFAATDKAAGLKGLSAFIVEKGTPGFSFGKKEVKMGIRASVQRELIFENCRVPAANLLGKEGAGFKIAMSSLDGGRIGVAAQALGIAQSALENAIKYAKERVQFGKPIANNQAIAFMIADMATKVEAARFLVYRAAYHKSHDLPYSKEAAMAKKFASDAAMEVTTNAVQIFGGYGFSREYPVERLMRDAKITQIYEGTNQVQQMVISGAVLR
ncbi:acyl-CoA dehydrogenase|uniref:Acyl-CoA dehydrogenase n=1 Tax=Dendrosporobacter quercicolus TaxID=146817 RepID=A0A1G9LC74_9FIRM|nr:acyl-CoA dehydrogenase [Dendrosporobacter quercicolus]NSL46667.1 acyl-CoA dehydrogenase [Dendrosporobacter quercicolus DSM 1736]SDL59561.1 Acyl-CoA dehydrogenase [Dendrosporobacter quercicolus]